MVFTEFLQTDPQLTQAAHGLNSAAGRWCSCPALQPTIPEEFITIENMLKGEGFPKQKHQQGCTFLPLSFQIHLGLFSFLVL